MNTKLTNAAIFIEHKDNCRDKYYLKCYYEIDEEDGVYEKTVEVPIFLSDEPTVQSFCNYSTATIDLGFGCIERRLDEVKIEVRRVKEKVHEMTVKDIEKKLGYKVKIVSEK